MSTINNLKEAFAGESQANRKYLALLRKQMKKDTDKLLNSFEPQPNQKQSTPRTI